MVYEDITAFLVLIDKHMDVGAESKFEWMLQADYISVENDGIEFYMERVDNSYDFSIKKGSTEFNATFESKNNSYPSGNEFEDFLKDLRTQYDTIAAMN